MTENEVDGSPAMSTDMMSDSGHRSTLDDIASVVGQSGTKTIEPCRPGSKRRNWWPARLVCFALLSTVLFNVYRHQARLALVNDLKRAGLTARLEFTSRRLSPLLWRLPFVNEALKYEAVIFELNDDEDVRRAMLVDRHRNAEPVRIDTYFDLTPAQRDSMSGRFSYVQFIRRAR